MQGETVPQAPDCCKVVEFGSYKAAGTETRKEQIEKWLKGQIFKRYGDRSDVIVKNPLIRLSTIFESLSDKAQYELYGYAKRTALGERGRMSMKREFWNFLEMAPSAWEDIEEFADTLIVKEKAYKQGNGGLKENGEA